MKRFSLRTGASFLFATLGWAAAGTAEAQTWDSFGVLAGSTVTNTGPSVINGNVGVSPGTAIIGFPPGSVVPPYVIQSEIVAGAAQNGLTTAFDDFSGRPTTVDLTGQDLGTQSPLAPGVYNFDSSAQLTGVLTLDAGGDPDAVFVFNIGSTLTTASSSSIVLVNGATGGNVYFVVGSSATLGSDTEFWGRIIALTSITLNNGANISCGAALARNAAVTLDTNNIFIPGSSGCSIVTGTVEDELDDDASENEGDVAGAIDDYVTGGGDLPDDFVEALADLTPEELAAAFAQLSGEVATGIAPAGTSAMNSFMTLVMRPGFGRERASRPGNPAPVRDTVRVLGYESEPTPAARSIFSTLDQPTPASEPDPSRWEFWAGGYGGYDETDGDPSTGAHDRTSRNSGIAAGADYGVTPDIDLGFALGLGSTHFDLADDLGDGSSDLFQAALYSRMTFGDVYLAAALAYAYHQVSTDRYVAIGGINRYSADFDAHNVAGEIEAGYRFGWLTPYTALRVQTFRTPDYSEDTEAGISAFALSYEERTATTLRTELGARIEHAFRISGSAELGLIGSIAWAHDFWSDTDVETSFTALPGSGFSVAGAEPASDSLLLSAGVELRLDNGFSVAGGLDSEFAEASYAVTGTGRVSYEW